MRRLFAEPERCQGSRIELDEDESRHAAQVLRARVGEGFEVLDGAGHIFKCEVESIQKKSVALSVLERTTTAYKPTDITLFQAVPKGKVMDWIVQKATELGVARIVPVITERTIVEIDADSAKVEKWRAIAIESIKQCGAPFLPKVDAPLPFAAAMKQLGGLALVAALHTSAGEMHEFFGKDARPVQLWIGPEGDFTPTELQQLVAAGAQPITLGPLVLRCDTAAISALALASYQLRQIS
jgi:16S rRNA (uracil1498-N3)-methyltransferase